MTIIAKVKAFIQSIIDKISSIQNFLSTLLKAFYNDQPRAKRVLENYKKQNESKHNESKSEETKQSEETTQR